MATFFLRRRRMNIANAIAARRNSGPMTAPAIHVLFCLGEVFRLAVEVGEGFEVGDGVDAGNVS